MTVAKHLFLFLQDLQVQLFGFLPSPLLEVGARQVMHGHEFGVPRLESCGSPPSLATLVP